MTYQFKNAFYIPVNLEESYIPKEIETKSFAISNNIKQVIENL